jgi:hypothetical protein
MMWITGWGRLALGASLLMKRLDTLSSVDCRTVSYSVLGGGVYLWQGRGLWMGCRGAGGA